LISTIIKFLSKIASLFTYINNINLIITLLLDININQKHPIDSHLHLLRDGQVTLHDGELLHLLELMHAEDAPGVLAVTARLLPETRANAAVSLTPKIS